MKLFKKNQIILYVIVLMLMTAGYLNYTASTEKEVSLETARQIEASDDMQLADIGDATLVNSNEIVTEKNTEEKSNATNMITETSSSNNNDYFVKSKLERDTMYSQMIENYEKVLNSSHSPETGKQLATQEIQKINDTKNSIMICENLIRTKGFENNVVFVNDNSISVIIETPEMKQEEVAQVQNIIARELKAEIENIHIATK